MGRSLSSRRGLKKSPKLLKSSLSAKQDIEEQAQQTQSTLPNTIAGAVGGEQMDDPSPIITETATSMLEARLAASVEEEDEPDVAKYVTPIASPARKRPVTPAPAVTTQTALMSIEEVPEWLKFNRFIRAGYRPSPGLSYAKTFRSLFTMHNESMNVWSHFLPAVFCMYTLFVSPLPLQEDMVGRLIMAAFSYVFACSTLYHLCMPCCRTNKGYRDLLCVDVLGTLFSITFSSYSFLLFGNRCMDSSITYSMTAFITIYGAAMVWVIKYGTSMRPIHRVGLFGFMLIIRAIMGFYVCGWKINTLGMTTAMKYHCSSFGVLLFASIANVGRLPERLFTHPGGIGKKADGLYWFFDCTLNGHNIWHFGCNLTVLYTMLACHYDRVEYQQQFDYDCPVSYV